MKTYTKFAVLACAIILVGQGCTSKTTGTAVDGALWQSNDAGLTWQQLATLPQATGVTTIANVNVNAFEIDPSDEAAFYLGTEGNGVLMSLDAGLTWQRPRDLEARSGAVRAIEIDPRNRCTMYVMKAEKLLRSGNCARTFEVVYTEGRTETSLTAFAIDWFNPDSVWMGTSAGEVLRSLDGARSWSTMNRVDDRVEHILISNRDSRAVLIGTEDKGIHRTADAGATWTDMEREMNREFKDSDRIYGFAQDRRGEVVYAASRYGILSSRDNGGTWQSVAIIPEGRDSRMWSIAVNPENANDLYYGIVGTLYRSVNGGTSWETRALPSLRAPRAMRVHPTDNSRLFIGFLGLEE